MSAVRRSPDHRRPGASRERGLMASTAQNTPQALDATFFQDPQPIYAQLREEGPVRRVTLPHGWEIWIVTKYDEARAALADPRLLKDGRKLGQYLDPELLGDQSVF